MFKKIVKGAIKFVGGILFGAGLVALFVTSKGFGFAIEGRSDFVAIGIGMVINPR